MWAGKYNQKITVLRPKKITNDFGEDELSFEEAYKTRANVSFNNGQRQNSFNEIVYSSTKTFVIRSYNKIENTDIILYKDEKYRILSINRRQDISFNDIQIITELINE